MVFSISGAIGSRMRVVGRGGSRSNLAESRRTAERPGRRIRRRSRLLALAWKRGAVTAYGGFGERHPLRHPAFEDVPVALDLMKFC